MCLSKKSPLYDGKQSWANGNVTAAATAADGEASSFHVRQDLHENQVREHYMRMWLCRQNNINNSLHSTLADAASNERNKLHDI